MFSLKERAARVRRIDRLLERIHGRQNFEPTGKGLDILVEAMLAQNTNLANAASGYKQLRRALPTWNKVLAAPIGEVQRHIAVCGLARMRARRLQALLARIKHEHGKLDINHLATHEPQAALDYLLSLHGIGPKTASYTLLIAFGMPLFPVVNGVVRVARRLRLIRTKARDAEASRVLAQLTPTPRMYPLHTLMFTHAKKTCRAKNPKCDECLLLDLCPYGKRKIRHKQPSEMELVPLLRRRILSRFASDGIVKHGEDESLRRRRAS